MKMTFTVETKQDMEELQKLLAMLLHQTIEDKLPIDKELALGRRHINALKANGINDLMQLTYMKSRELIRLTLISTGAVEIIETVLRQHGLKLKPD
jgi:DNA-directed RNA polymerase alpha subunit